MDSTSSAWGDLTIVIYSQYLLRNFTQLPLIFGSFSGQRVPKVASGQVTRLAGGAGASADKGLGPAPNSPGKSPSSAEKNSDSLLAAIYAGFGPRSTFSGTAIMCCPPLADGDITNADQIRGNVALVRRGVIPFTEKARKVSKAGAIGVIFINTDDSTFLAEGDKGPGIRLPAVMLTKTEGERLLLSVQVHVLDSNCFAILQSACGFLLLASHFGSSGCLRLAKCVWVLAAHVSASRPSPSPPTPDGLLGPLQASPIKVHVTPESASRTQRATSQLLEWKRVVKATVRAEDGAGVLAESLAPSAAKQLWGGGEGQVEDKQESKEIAFPDSWMELPGDPPFMFSFESDDLTGNMASFYTPGSDWSPAFSLESMGRLSTPHSKTPTPRSPNPQTSEWVLCAFVRQTTSIHNPFIHDTYPLL